MQACARFLGQTVPEQQEFRKPCGGYEAVTRTHCAAIGARAPPVGSGLVQPYESHVERLIREAQERGEFDNLRGAGKPLDLGSVDDPDWWIKQKMRAEGLDGAGALPAVISLRREAAGFPESLRELRSEASVRAVLVDYNDRVRFDRLVPRDLKTPPLVAPLVDIDAMVAQWREL